MKKLLLFTSLAFFTLTLQAQTFEFLNADYEMFVAPGDEGAEELVAYMDVKNTSDQQITVTVTREVVTDNVSGFQEQFCWGGICYPYDTPQSLQDVEMAPQEVILSSDWNGFAGYYKFNGNEGLTTIRYCFKEVGNESNQTCVDIDYCVSDDCESLVSVENPDAQPFEISSISPNPVRGLSSIQYNFNIPGKASLVVYNMVGAEVKSVDLDNRQGVVLLNASEFENGVYFYSLVYNGDVVQTKRMVVSK